MDGVPDDPEDWTDEEWLAWLAEGDLLAAGEPAPEEARGPSRRDGMGAKMLAASMRGLHEAIYGPKEEAAIVIEAAGGPPGSDGLDVHLDPDHPEQSVVVIRPWLLRHLHDEGPAPPPAPVGGDDR